MRILITGAKGQLGRALQARFADHELLALDRDELDITDRGAVLALADEGPELVLHAAAMTNVDGCETDPEGAYAVNMLGTRYLCELAQRMEAPLLYVSSDYVYDGRKGAPYWEWDATQPLSVYARSKLAGEAEVRTLLRRFYIVRTAWLYGPGGNNFPRKMLALSERHPTLRVVTNEAGHPTYAPHLADAIDRLVRAQAFGLYHLVNEGCVSRYDFARAIFEVAGKGDYPVAPADSYPRAATPPERVELSTFAARQVGAGLPTWQAGLAAWFAAEGDNA
ncbi:MAG: dTDP-4-dehydrorhamnose reductase [Anaerolineales bacterium]|nr:dTDP-4-dehydrorhamnose reductase [Anaerolineales bacterium]MCB9172442.1 dTDP-4-dehydrorhamnose reductase [Ardenticatenales bacterium]